MMKYLLLAMLSLPLRIQGQDSMTFKVSGEVLNELNQTPVPYAHVRVQGKSIGISANSEGKFSLNLDQSMRDQTLVFTSIGYKNKRVRVQDVLRDNIVLLQDTVIVLAEVVVNHIDPKEVILAAINRFSENYPKSPFQLGGFYRTAYKEDETYVRLLEASITISDKGFGTRNGYKAQVEQNRQSNDYRKYKWQQGSNFLFSYLKKDNIRNKRFFLDKKGMKEYDYTLEGYTELDGEEIRHIKIALKNTESVSYTANVYVRSKDFAIVQISDSTVIKKRRRYKIADNLNIEFKGGATHSRYVEEDGNFYLSYSSALAMHDAFDDEGKLLGTADLEEELLVLDVIPEKAKTGGNVRKQGDIYQAEYPYDPGFWDNFNLPVETELYRKIKADLNAKEDLNEQFRKNGLQDTNTN